MSDGFLILRETTAKAELLLCRGSLRKIMAHFLSGAHRVVRSDPVFHHKPGCTP
jgi:hypothetical protein